MMIPKNTFVCNDSLYTLCRVPTQSTDFIFYDPPYNAKKKYDGYDDNLSSTDYAVWMIGIINESLRIAKRGICIYTSGKLTPFFLSHLPSNNTHLIIVHKRAAGAVSNNYMMQYHSLLCTAKPIVKCPDLWNDMRLPGEGYFFREPRYDNPGMTSVKLIEKVLHHFTKEDDLVLDPFMGCGATAEACINMKRNFIGVEQSHKYCDIALERVNKIAQKP